jgi:hypothetical protein
VSEYQYYEFLAVDRPLDTKVLAAVRALSTRARITPTSFVNTYHWGDFKGDPRTLVEQYYDAFIYTANWGTRQVMLRLPATLLDLETAEQYCNTDAASSWSRGEHVILDLTSSADDDGDWIDRLLARHRPWSNSPTGCRSGRSTGSSSRANSASV